MAGGEDVGKPQILHWTRGVIEAAGTAVGPVRAKVIQDIDIFVLECVVVSVLPFQITFLTLRWVQFSTSVSSNVVVDYFRLKNHLYVPALERWIRKREAMNSRESHKGIIIHP